MPSYKKRVHSQRIPQHERPSVTPYDGSYDEKYSSDEENIEYEVCEPEDLTERSNSTVTFSEDIYDSDVIDDMIKSQKRKPSQISQEDSIRSEDTQNLPEVGKPTKSILKEKRGSKKKGGLSSTFVDVEGKTPEEEKIVSPMELGKTLEEAFAEEADKISEAVAAGKDKISEKGEKMLEGVIKPLLDEITDKTTEEKVPPVKGEGEVVTKPLQSTITKHQITDSAATNIHDLTKKGDDVLKSVTKPLPSTKIQSDVTTIQPVEESATPKQDISQAGKKPDTQKVEDEFQKLPTLPAGGDAFKPPEGIIKDSVVAEKVKQELSKTEENVSAALGDQIKHATDDVTLKDPTKSPKEVGKDIKITTEKVEGKEPQVSVKASLETVISPTKRVPEEIVDTSKDISMTPEVKLIKEDKPSKDAIESMMVSPSIMSSVVKEIHTGISKPVEAQEKVGEISKEITPTKEEKHMKETTPTGAEPPQVIVTSTKEKQIFDKIEAPEETQSKKFSEIRVEPPQVVITPTEDDEPLDEFLENETEAQKDGDKEHEPSEDVSEVTAQTPSVVDIPSKEDATKTAKELIDDITKAVEEILPQRLEKEPKVDKPKETEKTETDKTDETPEYGASKKAKDMETDKQEENEIDTSLKDIQSEIEQISKETVDSISEKAEKALESMALLAQDSIDEISRDDLVSEKYVETTYTTQSTPESDSPSSVDTTPEKTEIFPKMTKKATENIKSIKSDMEKQFSNGFAKPVEETITEKKFANGVAKPIQQAVASVTEKVAEPIQAITSDVEKKFGNGVAKPVEQLVTSLSEKLTEVKDTVEDTTNKMTKKTEEVLKDTKDILSHETETLDKIKSDVIDTGRGIKESVVSMKDEIATKSDKIANGVTKQISGITETVSSAKEDATEKLEKSVEDAEKFLKDKVAKGSDLVMLGKEVVEEKSKEVVKTIDKSVKDKEGYLIDMSDMLETGIERESEKVAEEATKVKESAESIKEEGAKISELAKSKTSSIISGLTSGVSKTLQESFSAITGAALADEEKSKDVEEGEKEKSDSNKQEQPESPDSDSKPRVIFRIESEDELLSDVDSEVFSPSNLSSPTEKIPEEIKETQEVETEGILEEKLSPVKSRILDLSNESLSKTKELVDERLRKISEIKPPKELDEEVPVEKPKKVEIIKIGRFHVTPALVEEVVSRNREKQIAERLKKSGGEDDEDERERIEKELPEKLTEADLEEVIRELKLEGLNTDIYLQPEDEEKAEKKERTLKRVERRFERMASETLEKEKEEADSVSEEKLDEKREVEFQRMVSNLSSEEVAESQQEYLQLWEDGGLSSLTPTDDWESRDPDTPENELEEDSPRKPESFRGSHGTGKFGEPKEFPGPKKSVKSPVSPVSKTDEVSLVAQTTPADPSRLGSSPSEIDQSSGFVSERSDDIPTYGERKKFWEQMSSSQSSETANELTRSMHESISSVESFETERKSKDPDGQLVKSVKQIFEKEPTESKKIEEEGSLVKSLTESYSKKIAAGEIVMPAIPRPSSGVPKTSPEAEPEPELTEPVRPKDSPGTSVVSELEVKLKSRAPSAPITEDIVIPGSTEAEKPEFTIGSDVITKTKKMEKEMSREKSTDSEAEFLAKYGVESVAFDNKIYSDEEEEEEEDEESANLPLSERKKIFESDFKKQPPPVRKSIYDRSMSLPTNEIIDSVKAKKRYFEEEIKKEIIVEQIMTQQEEDEEEVTVEEKTLERKIPEKTVTQEDKPKTAKEYVPDISTAHEPSTLISKAVKVCEGILDKIPTLSHGETHVEKSETEDNEKEKETEVKLKKRIEEDEGVPSITITSTARKQPETASIGESEDTQSESDVTPEDARIVYNEDTHWDGSGTQSGGLSPSKDDMDYMKEPGEPAIGRWVGQEDLSKQTWEKDELDSLHFKIPTKWERTRSEGASPKEPYVCTPEEHYPDTVWEVPVQEQLEKEEITHDIPIEKQVIIEKDEEEEEESEEESHIKLTEEEAESIVENMLQSLQFEDRSSSTPKAADEFKIDPQDPSFVNEYLEKLLRKGQNFNEENIEVLTNAFMKKHREIIDEDYEGISTTSEVDEDVLQSSEIDKECQIVPQKPEVRTSVQTVEDESIKKDKENLDILKDIDQTIAEAKESLEAAQEQLLEQHKKQRKSEVFKKESPSEFEFAGVTYERSITEAINEQISEWERHTELEKTTENEELSQKMEKELHLQKEVEQSEISKTEKVTEDEKVEEKLEDFSKVEFEKTDTHKEEVQKEVRETEEVEKKITKDSSDEETKLTETQHISKISVTADFIEMEKKNAERRETERLKKEKETVVEKATKDGKITERVESQVKDVELLLQKEKESYEADKLLKDEQISSSLTKEKEKEIFKDSSTESEKTVTKTTEGDVIQESSIVSSKSTEKLKTDTKTQKSTLTKTKIPDEKTETGIPESSVKKKMEDHRLSSEESPRSTSFEELMKSPPTGEEILSSTSSFEKQGDLKSEKSEVVFRHSSSTVLLKADRRSGTDLEPYSSSGESHYHSFEQTSSRPCSSDVEGLMAGTAVTTGSSEYESAASHDTSSKQATSMDYHTAVSSLSSRESIKSLDSESSGHLASVEVSSEASETLIPSAMELEKDIETPGTILLEDDDSPEIEQGKATGRAPPYLTQMSAPALSKPSVDEDFEVISESEVASWAGEVSEDEEGVPATGEEMIPDEDHSQKMKRSYEMTFQPEPKPIVFSESLDGFSKDGFTERGPFALSTDENSSIISVPDEKYASSLEESGSVLSMSLSTTSEASAIRTVIEMSHADSEKMDGSLTVSALSLDSASREDLDHVGVSPPQPLTNEMSTSTIVHSMDKKTASVTITTSSTHDHGVPSVSTQVTSVSRKSSMADEAKSESESSTASVQLNDLSQANGPTQVDYMADYDEMESTKTKKVQGHRRKESTSSFVPNMMWNLSEARTQKIGSDVTETEEEYVSDKYTRDVTLTEKEVKNDEKKEADDLESYEIYPQERKISEGEEVEEFKDFDMNRPQSQISRTDSESGQRPVSSIFSEDRPDSELSELMKQGSSETEKEDPLERPPSPEPEDMENKDITPEFSSEAQASVTELEMEYSGAYSRRDEYASHVSPIREEKSDVPFQPAEEQVEGALEELHSQTSLESTIAEKHELETGEKEILHKKSSDSEIPDITVTEHMTPVLNQKFQYPEAKEEVKEKKNVPKTPDTPASTLSRTSSSSTDQGREYNLDDVEIKKFPKETLNEEKEVNETKDDKESLDSPSSDSFEMLDKPDITDEFVIIEEVGKEAQENDQEGKSIQIKGVKRKVLKAAKEEPEVILSPPSPATKMTDLKYFPSEEDHDLFSFDSDSPPQPTTRRFAEKLKRKSSKEEKDESEYDQQIEQSKKWVEMQFQGEQAAKVIGGYGYEMEYERAPLEDIKEEDLNELDSSSKIGSMGSQKESLGSFSSVKDSFSSTPDYDVLAGKKYFCRSGDHDDVSMSSLQEFELIEKKLMENGKKSGSSSSQDSLSSKKLGTSSKSGQGDDVSLASLREFEHLEHACATVVTLETKAKQEEAILSEIDEGHESQISESESCETVSAVIKEKLESDSEDFDKRMFEIDEIIKQAQTNVEKFAEMQAMEKIESMGRGDSYEEVAKVPDLELDMPLLGRLPRESNPKDISKPSYSTQVVTKKKIQQWRASEEAAKSDLITKTKQEAAKQSELLENGGKIKSISADSLEIQAKEKQILLEGKDDTISLDSYKRKIEKTEGYGFSKMSQKCDSMEEVSTSLRHYESSSGDYSSSGAEHTYPRPPRAEFMLGSTDSLEPTSSTATHATYQYETDSVMSSSFTSGGSNTMVSSTDNLDLLVGGQSVIDFSRDFGITKTDDWLENLQVSDVDPLMKKRPDDKGSSQTKPQMAPEIQKVLPKDSEIQKYLKSLGPEEEVVDDKEIYKHDSTHIRKTDGTISDIQKVVFKGPNAEKQLEEFIKTQQTEELEEVEEVDEHGNVHIKKILRQKVFVRPEEVQPDSISTEVQKVTFKGPDAEKQLEEFMKGQEEEKVEEIKEVDEYGNVHIKRILRQRAFVRPEDVEMKEASTEKQKTSQEDEETDEYEKIRLERLLKKKVQGNLTRMLTDEELHQYLATLEESEFRETEDVRHETALHPQVHKITFRDPDAEKRLEEYMKTRPSGVLQEVEEVDEHGNVHTKIISQRIFIKPEDFEKGVKSSDVSTEVEKVIFKGPDAEKQLEEFMQIREKEEIEEVEEVDEDGNVHIKKIIRHRQFVKPDDVEIIIGPDGSTTRVQKVTFKGPDAEKQLQEFMKAQQPEEVEEIEEVDEDGNTHIKKIIRHRIIARPEKVSKTVEPDDITTKIQMMKLAGPDAEKQLEEFLKEQQLEEVEEIEEIDDGIKKIKRQRVSRSERTGVKSESDGSGLDVQKIVFKGPDAEKQLEEFMKAQKSEEVEEKEEVDEDGNVHIKRILKQKVLVRPEDVEMTVGPDGKKTKAVESKIFVGPDAEKQQEEFIEAKKQQQEQPETQIEERQEIDEDGTFQVRRIVRQPKFGLPKEVFTTVEPDGSTTKIQKVMFTGPDAEKQMDEFMSWQQPEEIEELEKSDEYGRVHIKTIIKRRVFLRPEDVATMVGPEGCTIKIEKLIFKEPDPEKQMEEFIKAQQPEEVEVVEEVDEDGNVHIKKVLRQRVFVTPEEISKEYHIDGSSTKMERITFRGPDAEKQMEEFMKAQQSEEVEEIEEVDEHGNVHVKKIIKQRVLVRPEDLAEEVKKGVDTTAQETPDPDLALKSYLESLRSEDEIAEIEEVDEHGNVHFKKVIRRRVLIRPEELGDRELTKEELQDYLKTRVNQNTLHFEKVDIGSTEPFVSEIIEPLDDREYSHIIHQKVQMAPEVQKVVFRGPDAEEALKAYVESLDPGEDFEETEEVDEDGNIHVKRILRRKIVMKAEDLEKTGLTGEELKAYLKQFEFETFEGDGESSQAHPQHPSNTSTNQPLTQGFSSSVILTEKERESSSERSGMESSSAAKKESGISQRPPLLSDISMDDEAEYDTTEHDWRHQLEILHAEADEDEIDQNLDAALLTSSYSKKN